MARRKVIITVAQTGAFHGKEANPNIPLTPEDCGLRVRLLQCRCGHYPHSRPGSRGLVHQ